MAEESVQRRLAAILAADVAGYSRLMGADEEGTLTTLNLYRSVMTELIEERGRRSHLCGRRAAGDGQAERGRTR